MASRNVERLVRRLAAKLEIDDVAGLEQIVENGLDAELFGVARSQKVLTRGNEQTRIAAARILVEQCHRVLNPDDASEFSRYASLCVEGSRARDLLNAEMQSKIEKLPKLSLRQLLRVADRTFQRINDADSQSFAQVEEGESSAENERRLHLLSGYANDLMFAVLRALNEAATVAGKHDLERPDALAAWRAPFLQVTQVAGLLNSLDYVIDSASFGDFVVVKLDLDPPRFTLDFADKRRALLRELSIRRNLIHVLTGRRYQRFVREQLRAARDAMLDYAIDAYVQATGLGPPTEQEKTDLAKRGDLILREVDAEDDLLVAAAGESIRAAILYHVSACLKWNALASDWVASKLTPRARRKFGREIELATIVEGLSRKEEQEAARTAWEKLTIALPARSHFDIIRRPFVRLGEDRARPIVSAMLATWTTTVREILIQGGEIGRGFGAIWEDFLARSFEGTSWQIVGRNIRISHEGRTLTEVDLLLVREDLLLVVEVKALTGSGFSPYDHWKNRLIIEKGCRQARLAADHLQRNPSALASIANKIVAEQVCHIQPLVLTNESHFDGWEHEGVPVAGETIRKAITEGTKVEQYQSDTLEVVETDWHLRKEDLSTLTILRALRDPIELKIAPEQGEVTHHVLEVGNIRLLVPELAANTHAFDSHLQAT